MNLNRYLFIEFLNKQNIEIGLLGGLISLLHHPYFYLISFLLPLFQKLLLKRF
ncbi:MAG: hypothetical protein CM15mP83_3790 [Flavobacteriaceae bacterium]|nr:MAG: hypothetical protein CM15mP83_3790 [Flavobacteriaceae bacterium]